MGGQLSGEAYCMVSVIAVMVIMTSLNGLHGQGSEVRSLKTRG